MPNYTILRTSLFRRKEEELETAGPVDIAKDKNFKTKCSI